MRGHSGKIRPTSTEWTEINSSTGAYLAPALTLPRIHGDVPPFVSFFTEKKRMAVSILALIDSGILTDDDMKMPWQTESDLIQRAIARRLSTLAEKVKMIDLKIVYHDNPLMGCDPDSYYENKRMHDCQPDDVGFTVHAQDVNILAIGKSVGALENKISGLGETVMAILEDAFAQTLLVGTPAMVLDVMRITYWAGCDSSDEYLAEMVEDVEDCGVYTEENFYAKIPKWAVKPKRVLNNKKLKQTINNVDEFAAKAIQAILEIDNSLRFLDKTSYEKPVVDFEMFTPTYMPLILRWSNDDDMIMVLDDHGNDIMQDGMTSDCIGAYAFTLNGENFEKNLLNLETLLKTWIKIESFLMLLEEYDGN